MPTTHSSSNRSEITVYFEGRVLDSSIGSIKLKDGQNTWKSITDVICSSPTECSARFKTGLTETTKLIQFGKSYSVIAGDLTKCVVNEGVSVEVPSPPKLETCSFAFANSLNTSCIITFTGSDLVSGTKYHVQLSDSHSFLITVQEPSTAVSATLPLGWSDTLQFLSTYPIVSITPKDPEDGDVVFESHSFTTLSKPSRITLSVDSSGTDSQICGSEDDPCRSMAVGWKIVREIGIGSSTFSIVPNTTLKERLQIESHEDFTMRAGPSTKPELVVAPPSSSLSSGEGMISVSGGRVWMHQVDVVLSDSPSLIFVRMVGGHLTIESCSITGTPSQSANSEEFVCSWSTGAFTVENTTTSITSSTFSELADGAINMKGGSLTIHTSSFESNNPGFSSFPSARRNIHCSDEGSVKVGSLSGGDGFSDKHPHLWLSSTNCSLSGEGVVADSAFFIPTLSTTSSASFDKKNQTFSLSIAGSTLIPCDLVLEVFDVTSQKIENHSKQVELNENNTISFNETNIALSLSKSSLSPLDPSLEWRGRLLFGSNQRTVDSFLVQSNSAARYAQSVKDNMKWWLPLAIVLGVSFLILMLHVFICWRRRKHQSVKKEVKKEVLQEEEFIEKMEIGDEPTMGRHVIESTAVAMKDKSLTKHQPEQPTETTKQHPPSTSTGQAHIEVIEVMDCVNFASHYVSRQNSLYHRLHVEKNPLENKRREERRLVTALLRIKNTTPLADVLLHLSSHWVKMNKDGELCLLMEDGIRPPNGEQSKTDKTMNCEADGEKRDGERWTAPEQFVEKGEVQKQIDTSQVSVFRLGLVLWEIETGQIPFGETDAVNACRQLKAGIVPGMDGVPNVLMRDLITRCLCVNADDCPSLETVASTLCEMEEEPILCNDGLLS
ncbi:hypothetical protein BLNAU_14068 [Blattamonas nauphoetae]|uniref:Serine-threonine/tyrosine-protein kinase catalytic domain-containing protein n=1 Tax=Blattamonas nauphoetae TaxID=2049346 RepID=A0ABQ9XHS0_9EUKA|nr:hypothetical protein BLNAU_14068 [Blattamonas nauphoetae]